MNRHLGIGSEAVKRVTVLVLSGLQAIMQRLLAKRFTSLRAIRMIRKVHLLSLCRIFIHIMIKLALYLGSFPLPLVPRIVILRFPPICKRTSEIAMMVAAS